MDDQTQTNSLPDWSTIRNQLLRTLSRSDFAMVRPFLSFVDLPRGMELDEPGKRIDDVYFIEAGLCSVVVTGEHGPNTEAGHIGRDGMVGSSIAAEMRDSPNQTIMQIAGNGWRMTSEDFRDCIAECAPLRTAALLYDQSLGIQVSHTLLATARYKIHERLARWLLMCHDRVDGDHLALTHEFIALMLTVRRSGVTSELHVLEGMHLIKATRGDIHVLDRKGLIEAAAGSYGIPEREYGKLFPLIDDGRANMPALDRHAR
jgi:CRP-like cAMP-binding protein